MKGLRGNTLLKKIAGTYNAVVSEYGLETKLVGMVTDNAANMLKAFTDEELAADDKQLDWHSEVIESAAVEQEIPMPIPK